MNPSGKPSEDGYMTNRFDRIYRQYRTQRSNVRMILVLRIINVPRTSSTRHQTASAETRVAANSSGRSDESESSAEVDPGSEPAHCLSGSTVPKHLRVLG